MFSALLERSVCFVGYQEKMLVVKNDGNWVIPEDFLREGEDSIQATFRIIKDRSEISLDQETLVYYRKIKTENDSKVTHVFHVNLKIIPQSNTFSSWIDKGSVVSVLEHELQEAFPTICDSMSYRMQRINFKHIGELGRTSFLPRIVINLLGTVGAGKGTQGGLLFEKYRFSSISMGDLYRSEVRNGTPIGQVIAQFHSTNPTADFAPDEIAYGILVKKLAEPKYISSIVLDGFPRTGEQSAIHNNSFLRPDDIQIPIYLSVNTHDIYQRLESRFICSSCGLQFRSQATLVREGYCPECNIPLEKRGEDTTKEKIDKRINFFKQTLPETIAGIATRDPVYIVHAESTTTPKDIFKRIKHIIGNRIGYDKLKVHKTVSQIPFLANRFFTIATIISFTNDNFILKSEKEKFVLRIPKMYMNKVIDRTQEMHNFNLAKQATFNPLNLRFFDCEKGIQVVDYLERALFLSTPDFDDIKILNQAIALLKKIHESDLIFHNTFNPFVRLNAFLELLKINNKQLSDYLEPSVQKMNEAQPILNSNFFEMKPCHNDPVPSNFTLINNEIQLIDWEYSGNNDPAWDLSYLSSILSLSEDKELAMLSIYSPKDQMAMHAKMVFFKPIIHLTISVWSALQINTNTKFESEMFLTMYQNEYEKYKIAISASEFQNATRFLTDK